MRRPICNFPLSGTLWQGLTDTDCRKCVSGRGAQIVYGRDRTDSRREGSVGAAIRDSLEDGILRLTKINVETRQGISMAVLAELNDAVDRVRRDTAIRGVIIDAVPWPR